MENSKRFWRTPLFLLLIAALCGSFAFVESSSVKAAPRLAPAPGDVVISEFRFVGPQGANDEFIELFNPKNTPVELNGLRIMGSNSSGTIGRRAILDNVILQPGQHYLLVNSGANAGLVALQDASYSTGMTEDGGIAITLDDETTIIDAVGLSAGSAYKEGTPLAPLSGSADQSYERKVGGSAGNCNDTNNNANDFLWNQTTSNPQNSSSQPLRCLVVTNVNSPAANGTYSAGATIDITVTFSNIVDVTGTPTLLLETGASDKSATYISGSGSDTLLFRYTVASGDTSGDLDYVATDSLALNGGTITGAIGIANLTLPAPGAAGSLGANKNIVIDNGINPSLVSIKRQTPSTTPTNANSLIFRVTFSEAVKNVDTTDFILHNNPSGANTDAAITTVTPVSNGIAYDITVSGGTTAPLASFNGDVGLDLNTAAQDITDISGNALSPAADPAVDEIYTVDNIAPAVTVERASGQAPSTSTTPVNFTVVFSEPIDGSTFAVNDITQNGSARFITWTISDSGDHRTFTLSAVSVAQNGTLEPSIAASRVTDLAGNNNSASTSMDNVVDFNDNVRPTVTVNQATTQADPTNAFPIVFAIVFSEPVNASTFTTADITQGGTATGITWSLADSGDHKTFSLSATAVTGAGTLVPSIAANRVADAVGNTNVASTSTDNSVTYSTAPPTSTRSVVINEIAWSGTKASESDEWIELYNTTGSPINLTGWVLKSDDNSPTISLTGQTIAANGYLLLARKSGTFRDITPSIIYGESNSALLNSGEVLRLKNAAGTDIDVANSYSGFGFTKWAAGTASPNYASMERGAYALNHPSEWVTYAGTPDVYDRSNNLVYGTPGKRNWINNTAIAITTIIADAPDPSLANQNVTVTVTVVGGVNIPSGTVAVTGANTNCTITLSGGTGSCAVRFTTVGSKTITATYSGDSTHPTSSDTETHQVSTSTVPVPTTVPTRVPPPELVVINEFVPRPGRDWNQDGVVNVKDEYIEVLNHGTVNVNLSGYSLDDEVNVGSSPYRLPAVTIRPGERYVFYGGETGLLLSDGGDGVRLLRPNGQLMDAYNYSIVGFPDQSFCRLPDNGGADDWRQNCFPTPGFQNSLSGVDDRPPTGTSGQLYCPIADTLPESFALAECAPFGNNIWRPAYWDQTGWYGQRFLPGIISKWPVFAE